MTSKQRAYLRSLANTLEPIFQIGKSGISENLIQQMKNMGITYLLAVMQQNSQRMSCYKL